VNREGPKQKRRREEKAKRDGPYTHIPIIDGEW
jgi:hypothetical protein